MDRKDIVLQAVEKLRIVKGIPICLINFEPDVNNPGHFIVKVYNSNAGEEHNILVRGEAFTDQARAHDPNEPTNLSFDELRIIRVARVIFDFYQANPSLNIINNTNSSLSNSTITLGSTPISSTLNVSSINLSGTMLSSNIITDLENEVKNLQQELADVKTDRDSLLVKIMGLETILRTKGII